MKLQRGPAYQSFITNYPNAEIKNFVHDNGKFSTVGIGQVEHHFDTCLLGVYESDGSLLQEYSETAEDFWRNSGQGAMTYDLLMHWMCRLAESTAVSTISRPV